MLRFLTYACATKAGAEEKMSMDHSDVTKVDTSSPKGVIVISRGAARQNVVELPCTGSVTIGRAPSCKVLVDDNKCSRQHCELLFRNGSWYVRDLDSRNGVFVDNERVNLEYRLEFGDSFIIGDHTIQLLQALPADDVESGESGDFRIINRRTGTRYDTVGLARLEKRREGSTDLFRFARLIAVAAEPETLSQNVLEGLCNQTGASAGGVLIIPNLECKSQDDLHLAAVMGSIQGGNLSSYLTGVAFTDRDAILAHDISEHSALSKQDSLQDIAAQSAICAPIRHQGQILGVIHLYSFDASEPMRQDDLEFVLAVADQMGDQLHVILERTQLEEGMDRIKRVNDELRDQLASENELVGNSPSLNELRKFIGRVAPTDALVLIRGESGVGKELVARAVHFNSNRKDAPFVCVNCAALTESLLESELFGHEKGAFTGATTRRAGKFEQADGGTLFLDEIGEMSPEIQAKFLRVLEGQPFERVGGVQPISVNVRVVTATNRDLEAAVREGNFRRDLFYRLQVIEVQVPPLREHAHDIAPIAQHFVKRFASRSGLKIRGFNTAAIEKLQAHSWPGNVRELRNVVERAVILGDGEVLGPDDIVLSKLDLEVNVPKPEYQDRPTEVDSRATETHVDPEIDLLGSFIQQELSLDDIDRLYIEAVLGHTDWNKSQAARILQIERTTLDRRLKKYKMNRPDGQDDSDDDDNDD